MGNESGYNATLSSINYINATGTDCLSGSTIISNLNHSKHGSELRLTVFGNNYGEFNLFCDVDDVCYINCLSNLSCSKLWLNCSGNCFVKCNQDFECPSGNYSDWDGPRMNLFFSIFNFVFVIFYFYRCV